MARAASPDVRYGHAAFAPAPPSRRRLRLAVAGQSPAPRGHAAFAPVPPFSRRCRRPGVGFGLRSPCRARLPGVWRSLDVCCASPSMAPLANNAGSMARSTPAPHQPGRQCTRRGRRPLRAKSCAPSARAHHAATRTESTAGRAVAGRRAGKTAGAMDGPAVVKMDGPAVVKMDGPAVVKKADGPGVSPRAVLTGRSQATDLPFDLLSVDHLATTIRLT